jgi:outer membrane lipoprotein SlyB
METTRKTHPVVIGAAVSLIIFSAVGVGVMTGLLPGSHAKNEASTVANPVPAPETPAAASSEKPQTVADTAKHPAEKAAPHAARDADEAPPAKKEHATCANCGVVESVSVVEQKGEGSALGVIAGGVAGALLGNQVGGGNGKTVATIAGAAGGAYAGNQIEKSVKKTTHYKIVVRMEDGSHKTVSKKTDPGLMVGDKVKVVDGAIVRD